MDAAVRQALSDLGAKSEQFAINGNCSFSLGFPEIAEPSVFGAIEHDAPGKHLSVIVIDLKDPDHGVRILNVLRIRVGRLAVALAARTIQLSGAEFYNENLRRSLLGRGFVKGEAPVPEDFGNDGVMGTLSCTFEVRSNGRLRPLSKDAN